MSAARPPEGADTAAEGTPVSRLVTKDLSIRFGGHVAVDGLSCSFEPGQLTAIVGSNGAGKTTYFNLICGQLRATSGRVMLGRQDLTRLSGAARTHACLAGQGVPTDPTVPPAHRAGEPAPGGEGQASGPAPLGAELLEHLARP